jgi:hypothetical protein
MNVIVNGEEPFRAPAPRFCIGQTSAGYTLQYGVDKDNMTDWSEATEADTDVIVNNAVPGMWMKLSGNTDEGVVIEYSL